MELLEDGYKGDVLGESTPDVLVSEFVCSLALFFFRSIAHFLQMSWAFTMEPQNKQENQKNTG